MLEVVHVKTQECTSCRKKDDSSVKLNRLNGEAWLIENCKKRISAEFETRPSPRKRLGFQSITLYIKGKNFCRILNKPKPMKTFRVSVHHSIYKRKTLAMFWRLLEDLWVTLVRSERFCTFKLYKYLPEQDLQSSVDGIVVAKINKP